MTKNNRNWGMSPDYGVWDERGKVSLTVNDPPPSANIPTPLPKSSPTISFDYDEKADVLYVTFGEDRPSVCDEIQDGILIRKDHDGKLSGITVINFKRRVEGNPNKPPDEIDKTVNEAVTKIVGEVIKVLHSES